MEDVHALEVDCYYFATGFVVVGCLWASVAYYAEGAAVGCLEANIDDFAGIVAVGSLAAETEDWELLVEETSVEDSLEAAAVVGGVALRDIP